MDKFKNALGNIGEIINSITAPCNGDNNRRTIPPNITINLNIFVGDKPADIEIEDCSGNNIDYEGIIL